MIDILKEYESIPASYPDAPSGLSVAAAALDADMLWARIESYIAYRWAAPREIVWTLLGDEGDAFVPNIAPVVSHTARIWRDNAWEAITLDASPIGHALPEDGSYQVTAQVGGGDVPAPVSEAFRRLAEYLADDPGTAGASSTSVAIGPIEERLDRNPAWVARAMHLSGAADLLRPYRRA